MSTAQLTYLGVGDACSEQYFPAAFYYHNELLVGDDFIETAKVFKSKFDNDYDIDGVIAITIFGKVIKRLSKPRYDNIIEQHCMYIPIDSNSNSFTKIFE